MVQRCLNNIKTTIKNCNIDPKTIETTATNMVAWRLLVGEDQHRQRKERVHLTYPALIQGPGSASWATSSPTKTKEDSRTGPLETTDDGVSVCVCRDVIDLPEVQ